MRTKEGTGEVALFVLVVVLASTYMGVLIVGCGVTPSQHAANLSESAQYAAELAGCREDAKKDGGWPAYESCACRVDAKHGLDASAGCP